MGQKLHNRIDTWKKLLLDFGKRNRLINFKDNKRSNVRITSPSCESLFSIIVIQEKEIEFPCVEFIGDEFDDENDELYDVISKGDVKTSKRPKELLKALKHLRYRANTSIEEQGCNILYLAFGLLKWKEREDSTQIFYAPLILVPVKLTVESLTSPYKLSLYENEIVVNPTLVYKLENDFGIVLPDFDVTHDEIETYFCKIENLIETQRWSVERCVNLTILSFLKINMYRDLERNEDKLNANVVVSAIVGEQPPLQIPDELNNYDHDKNERPIDTFQVVDADSSQQDAILLSKKGISFVLQGPPGTGKSQTITNIIAEAIADGKKVLFVSEKVAALQVVYNRLAKVGLADFCFSLHSHKANKKEILHELANSISLNRKKVREEALHELTVLEKKRQELNDYQLQLHTPCSKLNISIFDINGRLAKLEQTPNYIFEIKDVENTSVEQLEERIYLLKQLSITIGKRTEDYSTNVWRNSNIKYLTNELRHDIDANITSCLPLLTEINDCVRDCCVKLELTTPVSLEGCDLLKVLLELGAQPFVIPLKWIYSDEFDVLFTDIEHFNKLTNNINLLETKIHNIYTEDIEECNANLVYETLSHNIEILKGELKEMCANDIAKNAINIKESLLSYKTDLVNLYDYIGKILKMLGIEELPTTLSCYKQYVPIFDILLSLSQYIPTQNLLNRKEAQRMQAAIANCKLQHEKCRDAQSEILNQCDKDILSQDLYPMLRRFRGEYNSFFRFLNKNYKSDMRELKKYLTASSDLSYKKALSLLTLLKSLSDINQDIESQQEQYIADYGIYYRGIETDWDLLENIVNTFNTMFSMMGIVTQTMQQMLIENSVPTVELKAFIEKKPQSLVEDIYANANLLLTTSFDEETKVSTILQKLDEVIAHLSDFEKSYSSVLCKRKEESDFDTILSELQILSEMQAKKNELKNKDAYLSEHYEKYYEGVKTDWNELREALSYASEVRGYVDTYNLPKEFVSKICTEKYYISYSRQHLQKLIELCNRLKAPVEWYLALFDNSSSLYKEDLIELSSRMKLCRDNKYLLEEWVDYRSIREKCKNVGLTSYLSEIEDKNISSNDIVAAYLKRFYNLLLDKILPLFPAVLNFRGKIHKQVAEDFCTLDKAQFKIAQARVRERAMSRMPDFNSITTTKDEIGILKRELTKQRRLMPLRKLFMSIPNLLTSLKPCFMMSPLSVSVFLEANSYEFDMVIFDEASQVHTEDAIGAIMRGKQAIIVGDTKQLPPTNFFAASLNDDDYDIDADNEDDYSGAYESILDEAVAALPERGLRWHYRSKHEHLIAFSNIKIYNSSLITFPSSIETAPDFGVEYIYVGDGLYDRSKKRNNPIEANKVADLVFEHIHKYPDRSLGVVTFSEAQQNAVDAAIRQKRIQNNSYESFFAEDKDEPFFIKNLENVQGDERDTIIFSIGYARDNKGIMYMNFGPLSRDGGYRRLNVAITRAKYNIKLVGSIAPTDIDTDKTSSEGVKMLRSYIEFARQGISAIESELSYDNNLNFDSPFEEAVYDFLMAKGYNVITQIGCSGFRIDMAIKDPVLSGKFVLGIECDGATYHSSRTARERDRLRQEMLESMGWRIYRIWSTDWIKDPKSEEEKLVTAVENALKRTQSKSVIQTECSHLIDDDFVIEETIEQPANLNGFGFVEYELCTPEKYLYMMPQDALKKIIGIEQPIHFEELCRRMAPLYGRQKATSVVRSEISSLLTSLNNFIEVKNDFIRFKDFEKFAVRIPKVDSEYLRPINYICDEELLLAMTTIVRKSFGITPNDLFVVTARELGYKRTGENITSALRRVYQAALDSKKLKEIDGKVANE